MIYIRDLIRFPLTQGDKKRLESHLEIDRDTLMTLEAVRWMAKTVQFLPSTSRLSKINRKNHLFGNDL